MDYHLAEHKKAKFTKEPLEVSPSNTGQEDRRTDVVQLPIGQAMPCYTPCSEDHLLTIVNFLLNTLLWIWLWMITTIVLESSSWAWLMEAFTESEPTTLWLPPEATAEPISPAPQHTPAPVMVEAWQPERDLLLKTQSLSSSTPQGSTEPGVYWLKVAEEKEEFWEMQLEKGLWKDTPQLLKTWRPEMLFQGLWQWKF